MSSTINQDFVKDSGKKIIENCQLKGSKMRQTVVTNAEKIKADRLHLAGLAMQGLLASGNYADYTMIEEVSDGIIGGKIIAQASIVYADALIKELEK